METLTFNGVSFRDFKTFYDGAQLYQTPEKDVTFYSVVGRNGDLAVSNDRYKNKDIPIDCFIRDHFKENFTALIDFLYTQSDYGRLETTTEPDIFRMAQFVSAIEPETGSFLKSGKFTLTFNFKPQKYLKSGEIAISVSSTKKIVNPTSQIALPLIKVSGTGTITINSSVLTLATNTSTTVIDCELQDAYEGTINRNPDLTITNGFPVLTKENNITVSGCTIEIIPRWWRL